MARLAGAANWRAGYWLCACTQANFILLQFGDAQEAAQAEAVLCANGVIPRALTAYGLPHMLRLSVGTEAGNRAALAALEIFANGDAS